VIDVDIDVSGGAGIDVKGDDCKVSYCRVEECEDRGHRVRGDDCEVKYSEAYACATAGFELEVDYGLSYANYAEDCGGPGGRVPRHRQLQHHQIQRRLGVQAARSPLEGQRELGP